MTVSDRVSVQASVLRAAIYKAKAFSERPLVAVSGLSIA